MARWCAPRERLASVLATSPSVWGGHSCPPPLPLTYSLQQRTGWRRTRVSALDGLVNPNSGGQECPPHTRYSRRLPVPKSHTFCRRALLACAAFGLASTLVLVACHRSKGRVLEIAYVSAPQTNLRDRVAPAYNKVGLVKNGERVEVLDHDRRFVKVRTASGVEGWVEQRSLVSQEVFDEMQKLVRENQNDPVQAQGTARNGTNLHIEPG